MTTWYGWSFYASGPHFRRVPMGDGDDQRPQAWERDGWQVLVWTDDLRITIKHLPEHTTIWVMTHY